MVTLQCLRNTLRKNTTVFNLVLLIVSLVFLRKEDTSYLLQSGILVVNVGNLVSRRCFLSHIEKCCTSLFNLTDYFNVSI